MSSQNLYRPNAAVIITDGHGRVLLCRRGFAGYTDSTIQTVQGGIDPGETPREAAEREMMEELGITKDDFEITDAFDVPYRYNWPEQHLRESREKYPNDPYIGQEQYFFLAVLEPDVQFSLDAHHREFDAVEWGSPQEMLAGMWEPKRPGTAAALRVFGLLPAESSS